MKIDAIIISSTLISIFNTKCILDNRGHEEGGGDESGGDQDEQQRAAGHHHVGSLRLVFASEIRLYILNCDSCQHDQ